MEKMEESKRMLLPLLLVLVIIAIGCFSQCGHCKQTMKRTEEEKVEVGHRKIILDPILPGIVHNTSIATSSKGNVNNTRRDMLTTTSWFNPMDDCWRGNPNWHLNRYKLAECGGGFGSKAKGGKEGPLYVVTNDGDDAQNPAPGTLRYGVIQLKPLWIIFERDMTITLKNELILTSDKTIDGRGANVHIAYGSCITIQGVTNVIIHGLNIHHCKASSPGRVRSSTAHVGYRQGADGDAISVFGSRNIWIDHNSLYNCQDGLIDVIHGSTDITISNNLFHHHNKVMLLGHNDAFIADKNMRVTIAYNYFGPGCVQRLPRCRLGFFHVLQNDYDGWSMSAIEGSASPTILSQGNRFRASSHKEVTKRLSNGWSRWNWRSINDLFLNGAFFIESGTNGDKLRMPSYDQNLVSIGNNGKFLPSYTRDSGSLACSIGRTC